MSNHTVTRKRNRRSVLYLVTLRSFASAVSCKFCARESRLGLGRPPKHRRLPPSPRPTSSPCIRQLPMNFYSQRRHAAHASVQPPPASPPLDSSSHRPPTPAELVPPTQPWPNLEVTPDWTFTNATYPQFHTPSICDPCGGLERRCEN